MTNVMITVCPNCGEQGQYRVTETELNFGTTWRLHPLGREKWDIWFRRHWRECTNCNRRFEAAEIAVQELDRIIKKTLLEAEQHRFLRQALDQTQRAGAPTAQITLAKRIAFLINDTFGLWGNSVMRRPDLKPIDAQDLEEVGPETLRSFIKLAAEALGGLEPTISQWVVCRYGLQGLDGIYADEAPDGVAEGRAFKALKRKPVGQKLRSARRLLQN